MASWMRISTTLLQGRGEIAEACGAKDVVLVRVEGGKVTPFLLKLTTCPQPYMTKQFSHVTADRSDGCTPLLSTRLRYDSWHALVQVPGCVHLPTTKCRCYTVFRNPSPEHFSSGRLRRRPEARLGSRLHYALQKKEIPGSKTSASFFRHYGGYPESTRPEEEG